MGNGEENREIREGWVQGRFRPPQHISMLTAIHKYKHGGIVV